MDRPYVAFTKDKTLFKCDASETATAECVSEVDGDCTEGYSSCLDGKPFHKYNKNPHQNHKETNLASKIDVLSDKDYDAHDSGNAKWLNCHIKQRDSDVKKEFVSYSQSGEKRFSATSFTRQMFEHSFVSKIVKSASPWNLSSKHKGGSKRLSVVLKSCPELYDKGLEKPYEVHPDLSRDSSESSIDICEAESSLDDHVCNEVGGMMVCLDLPLTNFGFYSGEVTVLL